MTRNEHLDEHLKAVIKGANESRTVGLFGKKWRTFAVNYDHQDGALEVKMIPILSPEALTAAVWSCEGLPPVGCACERHLASPHDPDGFDVVQVVGHDQGKVVYRKRNGDYSAAMPLPGNFRPLRTAEQLAAEAREVAILQIYQTVCITRAQAEALYDAGYRKPNA